MKQFSFDERLHFSQGKRFDSHIETLRNLIPGAVDVRQSTREEERKGIDYVAVLRAGAVVNVDIKVRDAGCSRYWMDGVPDLALEWWSVMPSGNHPGVAGWTFHEGKETDLILFLFDPSDCEFCYLVGFQHLRMAFIKHGQRWREIYGGLREQNTEGRYRSACVFVPAPAVLSAIADVSELRLPVGVV